jgi:hypothetical protein
MNAQNGSPTMNQEIFSMGLSTEAVSAYLLCCSLADTGKTISTKNLLEIWNSSKAVLTENLTILEKKNILKKHISDLEDHTVYQLTDIHVWKR